MGRAPCCEKVGLKRGPWTPEEDLKLINYISENGHGSWRALPKKAGLLRCGKSCRLRWTNYLRPDIKRGEFSASEEQTIIQLHALLGNRWSAIASHLPKRTDNEIKNYWNTHLKKRLSKMGIDPATHKPKTEILSSPAGPAAGAADGGSASGNATLSHMAQWESARLEAEARLARESKMRAEGVWPTPPSSSCSTPSSFGAPAPQPQLQPRGAASVAQEGKPCVNSLELMTSLRNWEKSLQGQAGMMWPESWSSIVHPPAVSAEHSTTTCCSSPRPARQTTSSTTTTTTTLPKLDHGSPTSTLCSWDAHPHSSSEQANSSSYTHQPPQSAEVRKLSWSDSFSSRPSPLEILRPFQVRPSGHNSTDYNFGSREEDGARGMLHREDDGASMLQAGDVNEDDEFDRKMGPLGLPCLHDLVFDAADRAWPPHTSSDSTSLLLSDHDCHTSSMKREGDLQLELSHEEFSSGKASCSVNDEHDDAMADLPIVMSGGSSSSSSTPRPVSFSALLTEDFPDYWCSVLKDDVEDSSMEQAVNSAF